MGLEMQLEESKAQGGEPAGCVNSLFVFSPLITQELAHVSMVHIIYIYIISQSCHIMFDNNIR